MIQRRYNSSVRLLPRTVLAWVALVLVAASLVLFWVALQPSAGVGPWPSFFVGIIGIALSIAQATWAKDISILLGVLAAVEGTLVITMLLTLTTAHPA